MQFSPDGSLLQSDGEDGSILIDTSKKTVLGHGYFISDSDKSILVYQIQDNTAGESSIYLRDTKTGESIGGPLPGDNPSSSPDGKTIAFHTYEKSGKAQLHLWDVGTKEDFKFPEAGRFVAFSADSDILVYESTSEETSLPVLNLWDIAAQKNIAVNLRGSYLTISPDSKILVGPEDLQKPGKNGGP